MPSGACVKWWKCNRSHKLPMSPSSMLLNEGIHKMHQWNQLRWHKIDEFSIFSWKGTHLKCFYISWVVSNNPTCIDCWWYFRSGCFDIALLPVHGGSYESITTLHLPELVKEQFILLNTSSQCSLLIDTWLLLMCTLISRHLAFSKHGVFRWFKFTLKPPYSIAHDKLRLAIWDTSFWTFWLKLGHKGPWDIC